MTKENRNTDKEPLRTVVNRAKARWLKRMMYGSLASSTEKCFGYAVSDHLNCVTLDAWPAPRLVASRLGFKHERTVHRAAQGLQEHGLLQANRVKGIWRFSPVFIPADGVTDVAEQGHSCPKTMDKNVNESFLSILLTSSARGTAETRKGSSNSPRWPQRGAAEIEVAKWLGGDGFDVLGRLGAFDDRIVDRLCRAYVAGLLTDVERAAARLAAEQIRL